MWQLIIDMIISLEGEKYDSVDGDIGVDMIGFWDVKVIFVIFIIIM